MNAGQKRLTAHLLEVLAARVARNGRGLTTNLGEYMSPEQARELVDGLSPEGTLPAIDPTVLALEATLGLTVSDRTAALALAKRLRIEAEHEDAGSTAEARAWDGFRALLLEKVQEASQIMIGDKPMDANAVIEIVDAIYVDVMRRAKSTA